LTPFPHTRVYQDLEEQGRILHKNWSQYSGDQVVFMPAKIPPDRLQDLFQYAWSAFYSNEPQPVKIARLLKKAMEKETADGVRRRF
jgi:radical SAM superfamily enzyme YgiQ (UPF0313 family)